MSVLCDHTNLAIRNLAIRNLAIRFQAADHLLGALPIVGLVLVALADMNKLVRLLRRLRRTRNGVGRYLSSRGRMHRFPKLHRLLALCVKCRVCQQPTFMSPQSSSGGNSSSM